MATIGGSAAQDGNLISDEATASGPAHARAGISIDVVDNLVKHNVFRRDGTYGAVQLVGGDGNTVTRNTMVGDTYGVEFGTKGYVHDTDVTRTPEGRTGSSTTHSPIRPPRMLPGRR